MTESARPGAWGARGDFRKVTVTLPPDVYDSLVQESARRKSAGDPNHLLSAIAREWFANRQPLLPIERTELLVYRAADGQQIGGPSFIGNLHNFRERVGAANEKILTDLLENLAHSGWILMEKYSQEAGRYLAFGHWQNAETFFYPSDNIRLQLTIPGRRRKEALEIKEQRVPASEASQLL
jgi:hypothetical protein